MRVKNEYKPILVTNELHERLNKEKKYFQETIGGGKWSFSDTITELFNIAESLKK